MARNINSLKDFLTSSDRGFSLVVVESGPKWLTGATIPAFPVKTVLYSSLAVFVTHALV
jgi:hypothetical protein